MSSFKKYLLFLIFSLIVVTAGGFLYYFWLKFNYRVVGSASSALDGSSKTFETMGEITGGEIFVSRENGFRFRYPQSWSITKLNSQKRGSLFGPALESWRLSRLRPSLIIMDFDVFLLTETKDWQTFFDCRQSQTGNCSEVKLNGNIFKKIVTKTADRKNITFVAAKDGKIYQIAGQTTNDDDVKEVETVLETLSFSQ